MGLRTRKILCLILPTAGLALWLVAYSSGHVSDRLPALAAAIALGLIPPLRRGCLSQAEKWGGILSRHRFAAGIGAVILAAISSLIYIAGRAPGLCLRMHDDHVYMIQAQMLARGRLWMPSYPSDIQPFFDSFHLLMRPVYAGMYQPGAAMMLTPGVWLHWPFWAMPIVASSLAAGVLYLILEEMFGSIRAAIGVIMLILGYWFRYLSTAALSELPLFLGVLVLAWGWLRWRKRQNLAWAIVMGAAAGYCAITRPLDAICFCPVIGAVVAFEFRRMPGLLLRTFIAIFLAATPFLIVLAIQNHGLTGKWYVLGESDYLRHVYPAPPVGFFKLDFSRLPINPGIEKKTWLERYVIPTYQGHTPANAIRWLYPGMFQDLILVTLPHPAMAALAIVGLLSLFDIRRSTLLIFMLIFLPAYACVVFFLFQYLFPLTPPMTCLVLASWDSLQAAWPARRSAIAGFLLICILALSISDLPAFNPEIREQAIDLHDREQRLANAALAKLPRTPAVVLFRFDPSICDPHDEPVYNDDVAWPDDALIVRARDLGLAQDVKLIDYYARTQPDRVFYIYDRGAALRTGNGLSPPLGTARQLAMHL